MGVKPVVGFSDELFIEPLLAAEPSVGEDFGSYVLRQSLKVRLELIADFDVPSHYPIMALNTYGVYIISLLIG